jgi:hypothetical protein
VSINGNIGNNPPTISGSVGKNDTIQVKSMTHSPSQKLADLSDIDVTQRDEGSLIIWDETTQTFKVKSELKNVNTFIVGGSF